MVPESGTEALNVLVVEDNRGDVHLVERAIEDMDTEVRFSVVDNGETALDYLDQRRCGSEASPDLVLLDLNVPKVNGRDVLADIRANAETSSVPVVILSSSRSPTDLEETYELGADGYFVKPVDPYEFISVVRSIGRSMATSGRVPRGEFSHIDSAR